MLAVPLAAAERRRPGSTTRFSTTGERPGRKRAGGVRRAVAEVLSTSSMDPRLGQHFRGEYGRPTAFRRTAASAGLKKAVELMEAGRVERIAAAKSDFEAAKARLRKAEWRFDNCTDRRTHQRDDPDQESRAWQSRQSPRLRRLVRLSLRDGRPFNIEVELDMASSATSPRWAEALRARCGRRRIRTASMRAWWTDFMPIANRAKGALPVRVKVRASTERRRGHVPQAGEGTVVWRSYTVSRLRLSEVPTWAWNRSSACGAC